ncbi:hypothetical protein [Nitrosococcus wardiae]|nr:hypothetical protein [Nitrosococcus wardiae]
MSDCPPPRRFETGTMTLAEEAIYAFAREFDPSTLLPHSAWLAPAIAPGH